MLFATPNQQPLNPRNAMSLLSGTAPIIPSPLVCDIACNLCVFGAVLAMSLPLAAGTIVRRTQRGGKIISIIFGKAPKIIQYHIKSPLTRTSYSRSHLNAGYIRVVSPHNTRRIDMRPMSGNITSWLSMYLLRILSIPWKQIWLIMLNMLPTSPEYQARVSSNALRSPLLGRSKGWVRRAASQTRGGLPAQASTPLPRATHQ